MKNSETKKAKKIRRKPGDILKIDLGDGTHSYAHVSVDPCIIFYDGRFTNDLSVNDITALTELFNLSVYNYAISDGVWPIVAHSQLPPEKMRKPLRYKQDSITGKLYVYHPDFADTNYERPATLDECRYMECAAVWEPNHVVDRLIDHYAGRPNKWVSQLAIDESKL